MAKAQVRLAQVAKGKRETKVSELCKELGIAKATLYENVGPEGARRARARQVLNR